MARFEWIFLEKVLPKLRIAVPVTMFLIIVGIITYWYVDRDIVAEGCVYVCVDGTELKEGEKCQ